MKYFVSYQTIGSSIPFSKSLMAGECPEPELVEVMKKFDTEEERQRFIETLEFEYYTWEE